MTTKLDSKVKKKRFKERIQKEDKKKKVILLALLNQYGNGKKVAEALGKSPQTIYEQMKRLGIDNDYGYLEGEPKDPEKRKEWFENILKKNKYNIQNTAKALKTSVSSVRARIKKLGIHVNVTDEQEKVIIEALFHQFKTAGKVATALSINEKTLKTKMNLLKIKNNKK